MPKHATIDDKGRLIGGVDSTDDLVVDASGNGLVLRDTQSPPHYWRVTVNNSGSVVVSDLGTAKP